MRTASLRRDQHQLAGTGTRSRLAASLTLAAMSLGYGVVQLDVTIVNTALHAIGTSLGGGVADRQRAWRCPVRLAGGRDRYVHDRTARLADHFRRRVAGRGGCDLVRCAGRAPRRCAA